MTLDTECDNSGKVASMAQAESDTKLTKEEAVRMVRECPIEERHGIHTRIAEQAGVARFTLYRWLRESPETKKALGADTPRDS